MSRPRARELRRVLRAALARPEAIEWRASVTPCATRWDDGPCAFVALALDAFDRHRGEVVEVEDGLHTVYRLNGWSVDGHGVRRYAVHERSVWAGDPPPRVLVRLLRAEAARLGIE